ncbi:acetyl-CoA acetyltransferase [Ditylenchus destructor]|nr:acetyl-CoA acetyltransferase [Ditylenchus destructor]
MSGTLQDVYIASAVRTPIAAFRGSFAAVGPVELGSVVSREALSRAGVKPEDVEETVAGSVLTAGQGQNVARQIALKAGVPEHRNAYTVNKVCSSSLKALILASQSIQLGCRNTCLVVGVESMSQTPFYLARGEHGYGEVKLADGIQRDGISDAILNEAMGMCAEKTVKDYKFTRQQQDEYALSSYERAANAWKNGDYKAEVVPVPVKQRRGPDVVVAEDEEYKRLLKEKVPTLATAFVKDGTGTITAANASSLNDGAAAVVVVSGKVTKPAKPLARVVAYAEGGRAPVDFTVAPVNAVLTLLETAGIPKEKVSRWEINEAFSVTALAFIKELGLDRNTVNVRGGAVALGHPIGMSGVRIVVTLVHQLNPGEYGVAAICNGGGEATAVLVQRC